MSDGDFLQTVSEHLGLVSSLARRLARFRAGRGLGAEVLPAGAARPVALPPDNGGGLAATIGQHLARAGHCRDQGPPGRGARPDAGMIVGCGHDTAAQAITGAVGDQVHRALWQLPAVQPEAITLMDLCGCTAAEVAVRWPTRRRLAHGCWSPPRSPATRRAAPRLGHSPTRGPAPVGAAAGRDRRRHRPASRPPGTITGTRSGGGC